MMLLCYNIVTIGFEKKVMAAHFYWAGVSGLYLAITRKQKINYSFLV